MNSQEQLFALLFDKDEVTWQTMLYELVRSEQMDPWDIDIAMLSQRFLNMVHALKQMDFRIPGKIILAAAILLRIKSHRLVEEDILNLDRLLNPPEEAEGLLDELMEDSWQGQRDALRNAPLLPRTPQERKRKVSIYDLVGALQQAMEVKRRRVMRDIPSIEVKIPEKKVDVSVLMHNLYGRIKSIFSAGSSKLTFSKLIPSNSKRDKVYTFIPLLHLENQRKLDLVQYRHFGEIEIELLKESAAAAKEVSKELGIES